MYRIDYAIITLPVRNVRTPNIVKMLDVSVLVHQMHDTLSQIHETISSLDTKSHDDKLDALEAKREGLFEQIQAAYRKQSEELGQLRQARRDDVAEQRRREDEEIAARRKREDDELQSRCLSEDAERERKLEVDKMSVEEETERQMEEIELEAQRIHDEGHKKIGDLERKRRVSLMLLCGAAAASCKVWLLTVDGHTGNQQLDRRAHEGASAATADEEEARHQSGTCAERARSAQHTCRGPSTRTAKQPARNCISRANFLSRAQERVKGDCLKGGCRRDECSERDCPRGDYPKGNDLEGDCLGGDCPKSDRSRVDFH